MNHLAGHTIIQTVYYTHNLQGDPIVPHYPPHGASVDHVECFLEVNEIDAHQVIATPRIVSSMMHSVAIWSIQNLPALKPACSSLNVLLTAVFSLSSIILVRTLLGIDRSWIPL